MYNKGYINLEGRHQQSTNTKARQILGNIHFPRTNISITSILTFLHISIFLLLGCYSMLEYQQFHGCAAILWFFIIFVFVAHGWVLPTSILHTGYLIDIVSDEYMFLCMGSKTWSKILHKCAINNPACGALHPSATAV